MRLIGLAASALGLALGLAAASAADRVSQVLRPLERFAWPRFLARLDLPEDRSFVVVMHAPPRHPIDLRTAETALRSLDENGGSPFSLLTSKTQIGHAMVAWQCGTGRGFASVTGDLKNRAMTMVLRDGWGVTPMFSTYGDGRVDGPNGISFGIRSMLAAGKGNVLAAEVGEPECQKVRRFVADYISHPTRPARRYGLLLRPEAFEGAGCVSFALEAARRAGLFAGDVSIFKRTVELPRSIFGRRDSIPDGVRPFAKAWSGDDEKVVSPYTLLHGPWDGRDSRVRVTLVDPELLFAAVTSLRPAAGAGDDWRDERALSATDPAVARAIRRVERWARRYEHRRIAYPDGVSALVLER